MDIKISKNTFLHISIHGNKEFYIKSRPNGVEYYHRIDGPAIIYNDKTTKSEWCNFSYSPKMYTEEPYWNL